MERRTVRPGTRDAPARRVGRRRIFRTGEAGTAHPGPRARPTPASGGRTAVRVALALAALAPLALLGWYLSRDPVAAWARRGSPADSTWLLRRAVPLPAVPTDGGEEAGPAKLERGPWDVARPAVAGVDSARLEQGLARAAALPGVTAALVARGGIPVAERYWRGAGPQTAANLKSASKSILSALVGIALWRGDLPDLDAPVAELLPEAFGAAGDPRKRAITLRHLLSMTAGLETTSFRNYGRWVSSRNWVRWALARPLEAEPGRRYIYSTGNSHLLSAALTRATGTSTLSYARRHLFGPLGIEAVRWERDPQGIHLGGNNLSLRPRDLLRFGQLYLNGGIWDGERILPEAWIRESTRSYRRSSWSRWGYGLHWWVRRVGDREAWFAWGYGGQYLFVVPDLELLVVFTSDPYAAGRRRAHNRILHDVFTRDLVPAVYASRSCPAPGPGIAGENVGRELPSLRPEGGRSVSRDARLPGGPRPTRGGSREVVPLYGRGADAPPAARRRTAGRRLSRGGVPCPSALVRFVPLPSARRWARRSCSAAARRPLRRSRRASR